MVSHCAAWGVRWRLCAGGSGGGCVLVAVARVIGGLCRRAAATTRCALPCPLPSQAAPFLTARPKLAALLAAGAVAGGLTYYLRCGQGQGGGGVWWGAWCGGVVMVVCVFVCRRVSNGN